MKFAERLKELREEKVLSQMKLAQTLGISQSAIAKWELERAEPSASALLLCAKFFDVSADYLLGLED